MKRSVKTRAALWLSLIAFGVVVGAAERLAAATVGGRLYVCDSNDDTIWCLEDHDGSGAWEPDGKDEVVLFYGDESAGPDLSVPSHLLLAADGTLLALDGGTHDTIFSFRSRNGDKDALDDGEQGVYYDASGDSPGLGTPKAMVYWSDGSILVCDDGSRSIRVIRLIDLDGDGNALGPNESSIAFDGANFAGTAIQDPETIAVGADGAVYIADSATRTVIELVDVDGNGDFQGVTESRVIFVAAETTPFGDVDSLVAAVDGSLLVGDRETNTVLRLVDRNGDGDRVDDGEWSVVLDGTAEVPALDIQEMLELHDGGILIVDGRRDGLIVAEDVNGDGDWNDAGETRSWLLDGGSLLSTPSGVVVERSPVVEPNELPFVRGDANQNGQLELTDAIVTLGFLFLGTHDGCRDAFDADDDGTVQVTDPIFVLAYLFSGGRQPPDPFPASGVDPTPDELSCR